MEPEGSLPCSLVPVLSQRIQFIPPRCVCPKYILILSSQLHTSVGPLSGLFWLSYLTPIYVPLPMRAICRAYLCDFIFSNCAWRRVNVMKLLLMQFSPNPCPSSLFGPKILNALFLNTLSPCSKFRTHTEMQAKL
jgi:hypothetical protein